VKRGREALLALEKEGTVIMSPHMGASVKRLSPEEVLDIAEVRLALISLALKPAYRHLSLADFDHAHDLAKRITRSNSARDHFEYHSQFWDGILLRRHEHEKRGWNEYAESEDANLS
jgi:DNA-binding GntR family transcriptional regulator